MDLIKTIEEQQKRPGTGAFSVGDTVRVYFEIVEGKTKRVQVFEGLVLCFKNAGVRRTFTVRKISYGVGVERVFPVNSPRIVKVEVVRPGKVRRAKIYYVREKIGKDAKIKELIGAKARAHVAAANEAAEKSSAAHAADAAKAAGVAEAK